MAEAMAVLVCTPRVLREDGSSLEVPLCDLPPQALSVKGDWDRWAAAFPIRPSGEDTALPTNVHHVGNAALGAVLSYKFVLEGVAGETDRWFVDPETAQHFVDGALNNVLVVVPPLPVSVGWPHDPACAPVALCASFTEWKPVELRPPELAVTVPCPPGRYDFKFTVGGEWCLSRQHGMRHVDGVPNNTFTVYPTVAGLINPDTRCFLNAVVQALHAVAPVQKTVLGLAADMVAHPSGIAFPIVDALAEAFRLISGRLGPTHCHKLHHFAIEGNWFAACAAEDSAGVLLQVLARVSAAHQALTGAASVVDAVVCTRQWCMDGACGSFVELPCPQVAIVPLGTADGAATCVESAWSASWAAPHQDTPCGTCFELGAPGVVRHARSWFKAAPAVLCVQLPAAGGLRFDSRLALPCVESGPDDEYAVRGVIARSGGLAEDGHFVCVRHSAGTGPWWVADDATLTPWVQPGGSPLCEAPVFGEYMPLVLVCERVTGAS